MAYNTGKPSKVIVIGIAHSPKEYPDEYYVRNLIQAFKIAIYGSNFEKDAGLAVIAVPLSKHTPLSFLASKAFLSKLPRLVREWTLSYNAGIFYSDKFSVDEIEKEQSKLEKMPFQELAKKIDYLAILDNGQSAIGAVNAIPKHIKEKMRVIELKDLWYPPPLLVGFSYSERIDAPRKAAVKSLVPSYWNRDSLDYKSVYEERIEETIAYLDGEYPQKTKVAIPLNADRENYAELVKEYSLKFNEITTVPQLIWYCRQFQHEKHSHRTWSLGDFHEEVREILDKQLKQGQANPDRILAKLDVFVALDGEKATLNTLDQFKKLSKKRRGKTTIQFFNGKHKTITVT